MTLLVELRCAGLSISSTGGRLIVAPRERLTDELRERIRRNKAAMLADLERLPRRIRAMAARWNYSTQELADALAGAQADPGAWLAWVDHDERHFGDCVTPQDFERAYRRLHRIN
ncbi:MAG TPA: hypothetical protein VMV25_11810 [Steroidobacteraceae bacterium]|nr:hypothetical protein [Steroidobacteraceae bacterium]